MDAANTRSALNAALLALVVLFGLIAMHVLPVQASCATRSMPSSSEGVHASGSRAASEASSSFMSTDAHAAEQCTPSLTRRVIAPFQAGSPLAILVVGAMTAVAAVALRRRHRPRIPDRLSLAGGLRR